MKFMIASDIHGSAYFCERLLRAYERERADRLLLLGDLLYHGPRNDLPRGYEPKSVIKMLNGAKNEILCVRGNCEAEVDQMVLEFPAFADYIMVPLDSRAIFATHGHVYSENNMPPIKNGDIFLYGHTHVSEMRKTEKYIFINPGSVSIPKGGNVNSYMTLADNVFTLKSLDGDRIDTLNL